MKPVGGISFPSQSAWPADTLYLRQAGDGSILISVYQDAETEKLLVPADVASSPQESTRIGMQVCSLHPVRSSCSYATDT